jgi:ACR3 family arsenite transporter
MSLAERLQPLIILGAACFGLALGQAAEIAALAKALILLLLMAMLTGAFLHAPLRRLGDVRQHGGVAMLSLAINFIWTPLLAWLLGWLFLRHQPAIWLGLIMLLTAPCTDWYLVFTSIARGNLPLSLALLTSQPSAPTAPAALVSPVARWCSCATGLGKHRAQRRVGFVAAH